MSKTFYTRIAGICVIIFILSCRGLAWAQVNNWTNPASAPWEAMYWSLGVLPGSAHSIMITNAGYKGVGISPSTRANYPNSMSVSNLTVSAPINALSTLLLNFFGTGTPLKVSNDCTIGTNGLIENLYSAFEVGGRWQINGGHYIEEGGITVATNGGVYVFGGGDLNLTNASFEGPIELAGGTVTQLDGQTSGKLTIDEGSYNLLSGNVVGECFFDSQGAKFNQYGGTNRGNIMFGNGRSDGSGQYTIYNGLAVESDIYVGNGQFGHANFSQYGGTVITASLELGGYGDGANNASGGYNLTNGTLQVGKINFASGGFSQSGGQLITTNEIYLRGVPDFQYGPSLFVAFSISGGALSCPGIFVSLNGSFLQSGGTNIVSGDLSIGGSGYTFSNGLLLASNLDIFSAEWGLPGYPMYEGAFRQSGGDLHVWNTLWNSDYYSISGGSLYASNIILTGTLDVSDSALILNPGLFQFAGTLQLYDGTIENLGQMLLSSNSVIALLPGSHKLSFLNSATMNWNQTSSLVVSNWNGSTNGGGSDQLLFGDSGSGLTQAQLRHIVFVNPVGFPVGNYEANILPGGEVVPLPNPVFSWQIMQRQLVMSWAGQATLQSSTNVLGPYLDLSNASSPYTNSSSQGPYRFFRLRR